MKRWVKKNAQRGQPPAGAHISAQQRVLLGIDTLHLILQHVDEKFILTVAQRVCKDWHFLINNDKHFKARLFLELPRDTHARRRVFNPMLCERFPHFYGTHNPEHAAEVNHKSSAALDWYKSLSDDASEAAQSPLLYPEASWRRMHVTNPPTRRIFEHGQISGFQYELPLTIKKYPKGLRMADLYRESLPADLDKFGDHCQRIEWPLGILFQLPHDVLTNLPRMQYVTDCEFDEVLIFSHPMRSRFERSLQTMAESMAEYGIEYSDLQLKECEARRKRFSLSKRFVPRLLSQDHREQAVKSLRSAYRKVIREEKNDDTNRPLQRATLEIMTVEECLERRRLAKLSRQ